MPILQHSIEALWLLLDFVGGFVCGCVFVAYQIGKRKQMWWRTRITGSRT